MTQAEAAIRAGKLLPVLRGEFTAAELDAVAGALIASGVRVIEFTLTGAGALEAIAHLARRYGGDLIVGAGTVTTAEELTQARGAGAEFFVSPHVGADVILAAREAGALLLPGVFTPTEVMDAARHDLKLLKLFPAGSGGPAHLSALRGPFPGVEFLPTGGVSVENAAHYLEAGAVAVGIGSSLFRPGVSHAELERALKEFRARTGAGGAWDQA